MDNEKKLAIQSEIDLLDVKIKRFFTQQIQGKKIEDLRRRRANLRTELNR